MQVWGGGNSLCKGPERILCLVLVSEEEKVEGREGKDGMGLSAQGLVGRRRALTFAPNVVGAMEGSEPERDSAGTQVLTGALWQL